MESVFPSPRRVAGGQPTSNGEGAEVRLGRWLWLSAIIHTTLILALFFMPHTPHRKQMSYTTYTVDLVGGQKLGGGGVGTALTPAPEPKKEPKPAKTSPAPQVEPPKKTPAVKKKEKSAPVEAPKVREKMIAAKPAKEVKEPKEREQTQGGVPDGVRERLIQSALERVRERVQTSQKTDAGEGPGSGSGAVAAGEGGIGGGTVKGIEFLRYRNRMLELIKERWAWVGKRTDLEVTVRFGISESGEIVGLKIVRASGDRSYDDSVVRAVRRASPLPPPPESYRKDFMDVELFFRPKDLQG